MRLKPGTAGPSLNDSFTQTAAPLWTVRLLSLLLLLLHINTKLQISCKLVFSVPVKYNGPWCNCTTAVAEQKLFGAQTVWAAIMAHVCAATQSSAHRRCFFICSVVYLDVLWSQYARCHRKYFRIKNTKYNRPVLRCELTCRGCCFLSWLLGSDRLSARRSPHCLKRKPDQIRLDTDTRRCTARPEGDHDGGGQVTQPDPAAGSHTRIHNNIALQ